MRSLDDLERDVKKLERMTWELAAMAHAQGEFLGEVYQAFDELGEAGRPAVFVMRPALTKLTRHIKESRARMSEDTL